MYRLILAGVALILALPLHATVLRYDLKFEVFDSEHYIAGTGFLLADTTQDVLLGGRLEAEELVFSWLMNPSPLLRVDEYYGADVVLGGTGEGVNELTGETGTLDLVFLLWPPADSQPLASQLHQHQVDDIWSTLHLSNDDPDSDHWLHRPVMTHLFLSAPVVMDLAAIVPVTEPGTLMLLTLGLAGLAARRRQGRKSSECAGKDVEGRSGCW